MYEYVIPLPQIKILSYTLKVDIINMYKHNTKRQNSNYYTLKLLEKGQTLLSICNYESK